MFLSRTLGKTLLATTTRSKSYATTAAAASREGHNPLQEFFEADRSPDDDKPVVYGRSWKASELRLKSWDVLHKLWYVLLKEKNMLMTQRQMLNAQNFRFPHPERILKTPVSVRKIMKETCSHISKLQKEVKDLGRRLAEVMDSVDVSDIDEERLTRLFRG